MKEDKKNDLSNAKRLDESQAKGITAEGEENFDSLPAAERAPKLEACEGKGFHDSCSWQHNGVTYYGRCVYNQLSFQKELYCSDVFKKDEKDS